MDGRRPADGFGWVDDLSREELLAELARSGVEMAGQVDPADRAHHLADTDERDRFQLIPLGGAWFRLEPDSGGRLWGCFIPDPRRPHVTDGRPPVRIDDDSQDLEGWLTARADIEGSGLRWVNVLRRPEREAYVALLYDAGVSVPERRLIVPGVYPDISLVADGRRLAFIEPDAEARGGQRAVIADADPERYEASRRVIASSAVGGLGIRPCTVRRYFRLSHGIRSERVWDLVDAFADRPRPILVPGSPADPALFDVALLDGEPVLVQLINEEGHWTLRASAIVRGELLRSWSCATGTGRAKEITTGTGYAVIRVSDGGEETLHRIPIEGFSSGHPACLVAPGALDLSVNRVAPAIGFAAIEMSGGMPPFAWYFDNQGASRNDPERVARRQASTARAARETYVSDDGYAVEMDVRWPAASGERHVGPVLVMLYGAYGLDLDLDCDPGLRTWLDRGYAVATPHVRGGGPERRHLAGTRAKRDRSVADAAAAIRHLRSGDSAVVQATGLVAMGASAGGFLAATTVNTCPDEVDVCVIVNGFVDPLTSLLRGDTATGASDKDEWGDPARNPNDLETLRAISPVDNLARTGAEALVIVAGADVRVNPRQGLKWALAYRALGGAAELWFDPHGAHDCWGAGMSPYALCDWVDAAVERVRRRRHRARGQMSNFQVGVAARSSPGRLGL